MLLQSSEIILIQQKLLQKKQKLQTLYKIMNLQMQLLMYGKQILELLFQFIHQLDQKHIVLNVGQRQTQ